MLIRCNSLEKSEVWDSISQIVRVRTCVRTYVRACVRACVPACVRACVRACSRARAGHIHNEGNLFHGLAEVARNVDILEAHLRRRGLHVRHHRVFHLHLFERARAGVGQGARVRSRRTARVQRVRMRRRAGLCRGPSRSPGGVCARSLRASRVTPGLSSVPPRPRASSGAAADNACRHGPQNPRGCARAGLTGPST